LWYATYNKDGKVNSETNFGDFVPFGGWRSPNLKQVGGKISVNLCSHSDWHAYFDYVWSSESLWAESLKIDFLLNLIKINHKYLVNYI
jgi:hypothetical protein